MCSLASQVPSVGGIPNLMLAFFVPDLSYLSIKLSLACVPSSRAPFLSGSSSALTFTGTNEYVGINVLISVLPGKMFAF